MTNYERMYRFGITPWERYASSARAGIAQRLDHESHDREPGRALDLGCGRGLYARELARRGWEVIGVDAVDAAVAAARSAAGPRETYLVADVTNLPDALGIFDLFLDVGCLQGLQPRQRAAYGHEVTRLANPNATMLSLQFGPSPYQRLVGGIAEDHIRSALPGWSITSTDPADTAGLGWPMNRTRPTWYRLQLRP